MNDELYLDLIYQLYLIEKLLKLEKNPIQRAKYEGMQTIITYILERN